MEYTSSIEINLPVDRVVALFNDPNNLSAWMPELVRSQLVSGTLGAAGAVGKLTFKDGRREYEVIETVLKKDLPLIFSRTYKMKNILMAIDDSFKTTPSGTTLYVSKNKITLNGFLKLFSFLLVYKFKEQTKNQLDNFKKFAENK